MMEFFLSSIWVLGTLLILIFKGLQMLLVQEIHFWLSLTSYLSSDILGDSLSYSVSYLLGYNLWNLFSNFFSCCFFCNIYCITNHNLLQVFLGIDFFINKLFMHNCICIFWNHIQRLYSSTLYQLYRSLDRSYLIKHLLSLQLRQLILISLFLNWLVNQLILLN